MAHHVLVPFDEPAPSYASLEYALSEHPTAEVTVLQVFDPTDLLGEPRFSSIVGDDEHEKVERLQNARAKAIEQNTRLSSDTSSGKVVRVVCDYAADHDVDSIVVGSDGRTGARRLLSGNVAEALSRESPVPVTIVRES